jgi:hypothetical protein
MILEVNGMKIKSISIATLLISMVLIAGILVLAINAFANNTVKSEEDKLADAINSVKNFINDQNINVTYFGTVDYAGNPVSRISLAGTAQYIPGKGVNDEYQYVLNTDNGRFCVNKDTGVVELAYFKTTSNPLKTITMDDAKNIADTFAKQHYDDHSKMQITVQMLDHGEDDRYYVVMWNEIVNNVTTINKAAVEINASSGQVVGYLGVKKVPSVTTDYKVSKEDAINIAKKQFNDIGTINVTAALHMVDTSKNTQKVVWIVDITGTLINGIEQGGQVIIDAINGEVIRVSPYL